MSNTLIFLLVIFCFITLIYIIGNENKVDRFEGMCGVPSIKEGGIIGPYPYINGPIGTPSEPISTPMSDNLTNADLSDMVYTGGSSTMGDQKNYFVFRDNRYAGTPNKNITNCGSSNPYVDPSDLNCPKQTLGLGPFDWDVKQEPGANTTCGDQAWHYMEPRMVLTNNAMKCYEYGPNNIYTPPDGVADPVTVLYDDSMQLPQMDINKMEPTILSPDIIPGYTLSKPNVYTQEMLQNVKPAIRVSDKVVGEQDAKVLPRPDFAQDYRLSQIRNDGTRPVIPDCLNKKIADSYRCTGNIGYNYQCGPNNLDNFGKYIYKFH